MLIKYKNIDLGLLFIRLALALIFFFEGYSKLIRIGPTIAFFAKLGFGPGVFYLVTAVELIAGVVYLLGFFSEFGYIVAIEMAVILVKIYLPQNFGRGFYELLIFAAALLVALAGSGKYSLDEYFRRKQPLEKKTYEIK